MNPNYHDNIKDCINNAITAYQLGDQFNARKWSVQAVLKNPGTETGWILLAAVSPPDQAIKFLTRAISINPDSRKARRGLHWAIQRNRRDQIDFKGEQSEYPKAVPPPSPEQSDFSWLNLVGRKIISSIFILLVIALITLFTLHLAELGKARIPIEFDQVIRTVFQKFSQFLINHPGTYVWK
jgi:hypothetical protein